MSRMLEALKKIEARYPRPQAFAGIVLVDDLPAAATTNQAAVEVESDTADDTGAPYDVDPAGLHPDIQDEIDRLCAPEVFVKESLPSPLGVQYANADSLTIEETLSRAESAVASALETEGPDIYEDMAQYILTQIMPGRPAALLFTSPGCCRGQTEMLRSLSKTLLNHCPGQVLMLDALIQEGRARSEEMPGTSERGKESLEELKKRHQLVLIDGLALTNARTAAMIAQCDGVYLVIRLGYATPYDVNESMRVIRQCGGRLLGSVAVG